MDLKGSLVDTNLRIYPSEKLVAYLKTITFSDELPYNVQQIIKENKKFKSYGSKNVKQVHLTSTEIENLEKIREIYPENLLKADQQETELDKMTNSNKYDEKKDNKKDNKECDVEDLKKDVKKDAANETENAEDKSDSSEKIKDKPFLVTADIDWLYQYLKNQRSNGDKDIPYLHTLLEAVQIEVPENKRIKRNPVLEARCVKLRAQQEAREYRKMTKGVDNVRLRFPEDSISYQLKQLNRQLIAIGQFIISIFAGFLFGFRGVEWMVGNLDFGFRLLLGVMCALVIALAEIYFLAKKLNEELNIPETVQLGGPLKFADQKNYPSENNKSVLGKQD